MTDPDVSPLAVARLAAAAAESVDDVVGLAPGRGGPATYGRGERVQGVAVAETAATTKLTVEVVARLGRPLPEIADDVRTEIVAELLRQFPTREPPVVDVHVADVVADDPPDHAGAGRVQ